eukprot:CAMPEP_0204190334 /NCGR_PEP_ID=MMETSP0361-20130328/59225_1 /ASSEMBLY_ACC=CAM_ASM_000343 /TAXON_ID=268821 /ORGANISM="Scrippsiella Hangoei, Strain SHTV-5" /LENGTH=76 /DNA_ID=CAMNT_0051151129 /DNA_START=227 /DNA_END=454 /DNA_ORIENTATION=+
MALGPLPTLTPRPAARTSELRQALLHGQARHMVEGCRDDNLAVGILGVRLHTQHYLGLVGLAARQERLQHPRARTD